MNRLIVAALLLAPALAYADDPDAPTPDSTASVAKVAPEKPKVNRFYVRLGVTVVKPLAQSNPIELSNIDGPASLSLQNGPIAGSGTSISSATIPSAIIGYVLPVWHNRLSLETVLGPPLDVKFQATGTLRDKSIAPTALGIPTGVMALGPELGEAKAAPPMITAVYALIPTGPIRPFVGAGLAVMLTYGAKTTNPILTEVSQPEMTIAPAPGIVLQTGLEGRITQKIYARLDVKFIALMEANATVHNIQVRTPDIPLFDSVDVGTAKMSVWVNPLVLSGAIGMDF
ncbi:MAG TPA: OmpW family outer membrane protein [Kofleriaceae bacterium]|nr:OmpW family outer membrane protein [Kofleriaceae bacterium]